MEPPLSSEMMRCGSSMGEPLLPEKVLCVFLHIGEILNQTDAEGLYVKKHSPLSNQMAACLQGPREQMLCLHGL